MPSAVETWFRKVHIYLGLFFLFFLWLFSLSGLVLNHPKWRFTGFWEKRAEESFERPVTRPDGVEDMQIARDLMKQLGIRGEITGKINQPSFDGLDFRVVRPGDIYDIKADFRSGVARTNHIHVNGWGVLNMLHSFTGVRRSDPDLHQNWWATGIWRFSMDALSVSIVVMVLSGIYLWYRRKGFQFGGALALALGIVVVSCFLVL